MYKIMENDTGELTTYFMTEPGENKNEMILKILNETINNNVVTNKAIFSSTIVFDESDFLWNIAFNLLNKSHRIVCFNEIDLRFFENLQKNLAEINLTYGKVYLVEGSIAYMLDDIQPPKSVKRNRYFKTNDFFKKTISASEKNKNSIAIFGVRCDENDSFLNWIIESGYYNAENDEFVLNSVLIFNMESFDGFGGCCIVDYFNKSEAVCCLDEDAERIIEIMKEDYDKGGEIGEIVRVDHIN